jgi:DNA-binding MarR family transcriptional regulator
VNKTVTNLTQEQGLLLASIARVPEASEKWHKDFVDASQFSNNVYKLREHGLIVKNPESGVAKKDGEYINYQPEPKEEFTGETSDSSEAKEQVLLSALDEAGGRADSIQELAERVSRNYQTVKRRVGKLEEQDYLETFRDGNKKVVQLQQSEYVEDEPDYDVYMITGKGARELKDFIESQPGIFQEQLKEFYDKRLVNAPRKPEGAEQ